jgi:probable F420-dependent oxidoreductase
MTSVVPPGRLAYGMQLQVQSQSRLYSEPWEWEAGAPALAEIARTADDTGFFYVAVCDHVAIPQPLDERMGPVWYDTIATLGWLAALTTRVRLLSHVFVAAYRHPLIAAKSFMTLDELSGGRVIAGIGAGHVEGEFDLLGVPFAERGRLTDHAVDEMRGAFDNPVVHGAAMEPRPRQSHLPIWIGGSSTAALRRAGERGDGWLPQGTRRADMPAAIDKLGAFRDKAGRGDDPIDIGAITEILYVGEPTWDVGSWALTGPPDKLAASLREFADMGVNHVQIRFRNRDLPELQDQMRAFGDEVAPLL